MNLNEFNKVVNYGPDWYKDYILNNNIDCIESDDIRIGLFVLSAKLGDQSTYIELLNQIKNIGYKDQTDFNFFVEIAYGLHAYLNKNYNHSLSHYMKATTIAYSLNQSYLIVEGNRYLSIIYRKLDNFENSIFYIEKSIAALTENESPLVHANVYSTYGLILLNTEAYQEAKDILRTAHRYFDLLEDKENYINYVVLLLNSFDVNNKSGDYESANYYYYLLDQLAAKDTTNVYKDYLKKIKSIIYSREGKYKEAYEIAFELLGSNRIVVPTDKEIVSPNKAYLLEIERLQNMNKVLFGRLNQVFKTLDSENGRIDFEIVNKVYDAMEKNQLFPYYQLIWSDEEGRFVGAEALLRWYDGKKFIAPNEFISSIENDEVIMQVSKMVIRKSLAFCRQVLDETTKEFYVSINICPYQLIHQNLAEIFRNEMVLHNVSGKNIVIEITERSFLEENPKILEGIYGLKKLGIQIALDDFGTGYSSLSSVNDYPIDIIKLDRSLIRNIENDLKSKKLISGIISLMQALDLKIVCEGVEDQYQIETLKSLSCHFIQGYYYSKPSSQEDSLNALKQ